MDLIGVQSGTYKHYKGPLYLVLGVAHDSNAEDLFVTDTDSVYDARPLGERRVVVYVALNTDKSGPAMAVRSIENFTAKVCTVPEHRHYGEAPDDDVVCNAVQRFTYLGIDRP